MFLRSPQHLFSQTLNLCFFPFSFLEWGVPVFWNCFCTWVYRLYARWWANIYDWWNEYWHGKCCHSENESTKNPTWTVVGSNPGRHNDIPGYKFLRCDWSFCFLWVAEKYHKLMKQHIWIPAYMRRTAGYTWTDYKTNAQVTAELKMTPILEKITGIQEILDTTRKENTSK